MSSAPKCREQVRTGIRASEDTGLGSGLARDVARAEARGEPLCGCRLQEDSSAAWRSSRLLARLRCGGSVLFFVCVRWGVGWGLQSHGAKGSDRRPRQSRWRE